MYDLKDILLEAQAEVGQIVQASMEELMEPQMTTALRLRWDTLPDEAKEVLKQQQPQAYRRLMQLMNQR